jgi:hypothetical protein
VTDYSFADALFAAFVREHGPYKEPEHPGEACRDCEHDHWLMRCRQDGCDCFHHCVCPPEEHDWASLVDDLSA